MPDTTLIAVVVGGLVAAVPTIATTLVNVRSSREHEDRTHQRDQARDRAALYEDFMAQATLFDFAASIAGNSLRRWARDNGEPVPGDGDAAERDTNLRLQLSRLELRGADDVASVAKELATAWSDDISAMTDWRTSQATESQPRNPTRDEFNAIVGAGYAKKYTALIDAMRADLRASNSS